MTNPNATLRVLVTYALIIPVAVLVGYLLTNPLTYGTLGFLVFIIALILSPVFIKWHYPILIFGLGFPAQMFFLKGNPPFWEVMVILSLGISIVERTLNAQKRFLSAPAMTWALLFTAAAVFTTMELTGGFGLHSVGGGMGGGKKYISVYLGIATFFALASQGIPPAKRKLYVGLFFLSGAFAFIGDLFPLLPGPLKYINLVFPPTGYLASENFGAQFSRMAALSKTAIAIMMFMLARYRLRELLSLAHPFRGLFFLLMFALSQTGGFRASLIGNALILAFIFYLEGLHRTRWLFVAMVSVLVAGAVVVPFTRELPYNVQRSLSFLPLNVDPVAKADAEASTEWRLNIWKAVLPTVPDYLLLGKGYALTSRDYEDIGPDSPFAAAARANASLESLAISNDFHSGPLSTVICFGVWGAISILAIMGAGFFILYRNFKYGDPSLLTVNTLLLAIHLEHMLHFIFIFGAYDGDVGYFARIVGFSVALNWGVARPKPRPAASQPVRPLSAQLSAGTPQAA